jgi:hypothetical protein
MWMKNFWDSKSYVESHGGYDDDDDNDFGTAVKVTVVVILSHLFLLI